jgi:hypothetical protein
MRWLQTRIAGFLLLAAGTLLSTGCMMTPGHGEDVGLKTDPVSFVGALREPGKLVYIQARDRENNHQWRTVGSTRSSTSAVQYSGLDWYLWSRDITLAHRHWYINGSPQFWSAEVRAIDSSTGNALGTFDAGFGDYFDFGVPLEEMMEQHLHGQSATIYARAY